MTKSFIKSLVAFLPFLTFAYSVEDCESTKASLLQEISDIEDDISFARTYSTATVMDMPPLHDFLVSQGYGEYTYAVMAVDNTRYHAERTTNLCDSASIILSSMRSEITNIDCVSCSASSDCPCTNQFASITSYLHTASMYQSFVSNSVYGISNILINIAFSLRANTNLLSRILNTLTDLGGLDIMYSYYHMYLEEDVGMYPTEWNMGYPTSPGILAYLNATFDNLSFSTASLNNYFYHFLFEEFYPYSVHMTNNVTTLTQASTNFFSLFQGEAVLSDYWKFPSSVRREVSYYQFLTNHYIAVSQGESSYGYQGVDVEITKTNWLDRIETLLAAIVFNDGGAVSNTVNANYQQEDPDGLIAQMSEAFTDLENDPQSSLSALRDTSESLVSSIRKFSTAFQDASMPGTIRLANIGSTPPDSRSSSGDSIEFSTSEGGPFFEMCRCATTIAWTLCGIILVVVFLSWSAKTSYNMFLFCWDVFNGIFAK